MSNVIPMRAPADIPAMYQALPNEQPKVDLCCEQADAIYQALSLMPPADRDAALAAVGDERLRYAYEVWLETL